MKRRNLINNQLLIMYWILIQSLQIHFKKNLLFLYFKTSDSLYKKFIIKKIFQSYYYLLYFIIFYSFNVK